MRLLHVTGAEGWAAAQGSGRHPAGGLPAGAFLHACTTSQLGGVLARVVGSVGDRAPVLLVLDVAACAAAGAPVRWAAPHRADGPFPHVHGAVPVAAVVAVLELGRSPGGAVEVPPVQLLTGLGVLAEPPRAASGGVGGAEGA